ncbi:MAG: hypothetical protein AAFQ79_01445 [Pseudomonadota bacterium]
MILTLDVDLPPGALLPAVGPDAAHMAAERGVVWFSANPPGCRVADGRVEGIEAVGGGSVAEPVEENTGNCRHVVANGQAYLSLTDRSACGFSAEIGSVSGVLSFAVIFAAPKGPARTLAAVSAAGARDYIALTQDARNLTLARRNGAEIGVRCPPLDQPVLVLARVDADGLWLAQGDGPPVHAADPEALPTGPVAGFIGCRRQRAGLYKTLGAGHLYDIAFMPEIDVFSPALDTLRAAMVARTEDIGAYAV